MNSMCVGLSNKKNPSCCQDGFGTEQLTGVIQCQGQKLWIKPTLVLLIEALPPEVELVP
jgi:hypothetical protein